MRSYLKILILLLCSSQCFSQQVLKIAAWGGEIPQALIHQFEKKTNIKVFLTTVESNESLLIKLKTAHQNIYDIIAPSNYYIEMLARMGMIQELNPQKISQIKNINPIFIHPEKPLYSVPFIYGASGIFYNQHWIQDKPKYWQDLWKPKYQDKLLLLDDTREVFSMSLLSQKKLPNTQNPQEIQSAFEHLLKLIPNIKLFASDAVTRIITDEDAQIGMAWNGDVVKARVENPDIQFVYPEEGFIIWSEGFAITKNAQNVDGAYAFINFILEPKHSALITKKLGFSVSNERAKVYLPKSLVEDRILFPPTEVLKRGVLQEGLSADALELYNTYWEKLKLSI